MSTSTRSNLVRDAWRQARDRLLAERQPDGWWAGRLSDSALATATAVSALCMLDREGHDATIARAVAWLEADQNPDGGWGDAPVCPSNLSTTLLVRAALTLAETRGHTVDRAEAYLTRAAGDSPEARVQAVLDAYGRDRSFAVPILSNLALADLADWRRIPRLPFELSCLSHRVLKSMRLGVVSYALPALIAIGVLLHDRRPTRVPVLRQLRHLAVGPALRKLRAIQPDSGGFLEAVPLTSFVMMSLAAVGRADHPVVADGLRFLRDTVRPNGSWPIDTDLSCWLTSSAVTALDQASGWDGLDRHATIQWLLARQHRQVHPFTASAPGGWGWTHRPGGIPDADDTPAALLALAGGADDRAAEAAGDGVGWLLDLQNADGGWPTFCRGWNRLPFDKSAPDLTAHVLRALARWPKAAEPGALARARQRGLDYLAGTQNRDGAWMPLWFGNPLVADQTNPVFGTSRVLAAYRDLGLTDAPEARHGVTYLVAAQGTDGAWGGASEVAPSIEETALAVDALTGWHEAAAACRAGAEWLARQVGGGGLDQPAPIGLYFARLWYSERLYPIIWTVGALGRVIDSTSPAAIKG